jgi:transcriptional regulator with XRE-family HTH domain
MLVTYDETIKTEIRAEMVRQHLNQSQLAERLGWRQQQLSRRLSGHTEMKISELQQIATALGADLKIEFYVSGRRGVRS